MKKSFSILLSLTVLSLGLSVTVPAHAQTASTPFCYTFSINLGEGSPLNTQDAKALAQALANAGVWNTRSPIITIYDDAVASAVSGFQEKYAAQILVPNGLSYGTGYVGAATRAQLNNLYGCPNPANNGTQQTFQCPLGWSCIPPTQNPVTYSCPTGWTCMPIIPTPAQSISSPIIATPITPTNGSLVEGAGVKFSLSSPPTLIKQISPADLSGNHNANYTATFDVQATTFTNAVLGLPNSSMPAVFPNNSMVSIFKNSTDINGPSVPLSNLNPTVTYSQPANTILSNDGNFFTIGANQTVIIPVSVSFDVQNPGSDAYSVVVRGVDWSSSVGGAIQYSGISALNAAALMTSSI